MNKQPIFIGAGVLVVAVAAFFFTVQDITEKLPLPNNNGEEGIIEYKDTVRITSPRANQTVTSPLHIAGEARGSWFFEATFPVRLLDSEGAVLANYYIQTPLNWMTEDYVAFSTNLAFEAPQEGTGTLVLYKSNPSGLLEHDDQFEIPVQFGATIEDPISVRIHFSTGGETDCTRTQAVTRQIPRTQAIARSALQELFKGSTQSEQNLLGLYTAINPGVTIQRISIENGVAYVDFSDELELNVGGSCRVAAIYSQIRNTLLEFSTVNDVVLSVNGRT
ncbi:MAG: GerMN domain-containing protein, partial [bacterium]|nr:GerMN domain-containing protein [bacterium]